MILLAGAETPETTSHSQLCDPISPHLRNQFITHLREHSHHQLSTIIQTSIIW